ncbi:MAG: pyridoxal-dependent decarboxylase [Archangium sp.]
MDALAPWFLGAYGENDDFFEKMVLELLRDHVFWRRNFHPEDPPPIGTRAQFDPSFLEGLARTRHELHQLTAQLKRSVPFFHPRYLGHMVSDLLMPGLIAQLTTTLYNPNNIVEDAAPVTVKLELEVGRQLCRMLGFPDATSWGHLTGGGTVANDEGLWLARAVKLYPLAVADACAALDVSLEPLREAEDDYSLLEWSPAQCLALAETVTTHPRAKELVPAIEERRVENLGLASFAAAFPVVSELAVLAPGTAHYSWKKAMRLLGLGSAQLIEVPTSSARMDVGALEEELERRRRARQPVLAVVGVYGSTEFGTLDPLHEIAELRRARGQHFWFHVDAAWGGYLPSLFRDGSGALRPREEIASEFRHFPSERVHRTTRALAEADSITVDPHKLGFVPFGVGALLVRDKRSLRLVEQQASYVFDEKSREREFDHPGRFSLEGSRPGAAAAACYVNHRVLPLDAANFGRLIARSISSCEYLYDRLRELAPRLSPQLKLCIPFEPDCNLVCVAFNQAGNRSLASANAFSRRVADALRVRVDQPVQLRTFFGSSTTVSLQHLGQPERDRLARELELDLHSPDAPGLFMLRHTLMNPWLLSKTASFETYVDEYCHFLTGLLTESPPKA